ncbi:MULTISPECIES: non-ribosomal peptide synthetase [Pelosinus]|uniref:Amino acid adenylation domain protein n=1 Tax=Pelosinus fermentans B4 TaxID=1149862 RepID=I9L7X6_9FIRM|nr:MULTISPECIES: non-ribosomal peptide synthetase [Pelosinus]EIW16351.1 amino acid adenylation domain protein [Pelosinus fermentans B4]EIW22669.1 amino acid adenylation domain protein [Pelosinus fermentans A11]OAM95658.1 amino acid adenylation domain protein [Pelosinus fermentans DSM 17108]SDR31195.1 pyochelin synthetase [Pelosinus fermentans]
MIPNCKININSLVARLRGEGVSLWAENGKLRYRAPQGMLAGSDLQSLKDYKTNILSLLQSEAKPVTVEYHPESRYEPFPLTDVQFAYLLGRSEVFGYGGVACHIYLELNYPELERRRVEAAWNKLVLRHDMLRAVINKNGYQQVMEKVPRLDVAYTDAGAWETDKVSAQLDDIREEMGHRIYNTDCWPLFGVAVTKTPDRAVLHFSIEFLIADWASIWLLLSEFEALYYEPERMLPDFKLSFRDYLIAERSLRESIVYAKDKDYWFRRIDDLPLAPDLPMARFQTNFGQARFSRRFLKLDAQSWNGLKQKAQQRGLTPTAAVMTAYAAVLERWSRNKKFCLNLTVLNRLPLHSQVNDIVGDFTSVSLLAVDWYTGNSFTERAKTMNKQLFEDLDHRLFSGVEVLREISRRRGREAALMPIVFTSAIGLVEPTEGNCLQGKVEGQGISQTPQVFIDCQAMDSSSGLQVNWDIREGVFPEGMTDDMFDAFESLLRLLGGMQQVWDAGETAALPAWQLSERQRVNDTKMTLPDGLLHSGILAQAAATPDRPAVLDSKGQVTYGELMLIASAVAGKLQETGCKQQDRVAIIMDKSVHQVAAVLGALSAGAVYVPVDTTQPELRRSAMLKKTNVLHVLTCSTSGIKWPENITVIEVDKLTPHRENALVADYDPDMPAYIIHTSGSTGQPKGVVITHRAAANTITDINSRFKVGRDDKVLGLAQLSFDLSVYDIFGILSAGGTLIYPSADRQTDPSHWVELMAEHEITVWNSVPALVQMLVAYLNSESKIDLAKFRLAMLSGDWIPLTLPDTLIKRVPSVQVISLGGATEASIWSNYHVYQGLQPDWSSIPYGRPLANQGFRILDERLRDCPVWVMGGLYITGDGLAKGYFGDKETTEARFFPHHVDGQRLYHTGDMGRYMPGGEIEFLGREDNQVKIKGHRIELGEIEAALQKHPAVAAAAVVVDSSGDNKALIGIVETVCFKQNSIPVNAATLADFLSQRLPAYMIPAAIQIVDALPLTGNGKIDRRELAKWKIQSITDDSVMESIAGISDPLEEQLLRIWAEALGMPVIGRLQNFYDHGADSLIMAQVAGKLREIFAGESLMLDIPFDALLRQMLNYPTVAALAEFVRLQSNKTGHASVDDSIRQQKNNSSNAVLTSYGGGTGALRVVFHAGLGTMNCFRQLLTHLDEQNSGPVIGITVADTDLYCSLDHSGLIEHLADDYAERLIETGHKEMQLIGYSLGGLIAVEVARRLLEKGIHLLDLVLIDSPPVLYDIDDNLVIESLFIQNLHIPLEKAGFSSVNQDEFVRGLRHMFEVNNHSIPAGASLAIGGDEGLDKVGDLFRRLSVLSTRDRFTVYVEAVAKVTGDKMPVEMAEGMFKVFRQSLKSAHFTPQPYMGDIRFLLAREPFALMPWTNETTLGFWKEICLGKFSVQKIAGNHFTCIVAEPNASDLARVIGDLQCR